MCASYTFISVVSAEDLIDPVHCRPSDVLMGNALSVRSNTFDIPRSSLLANFKSVMATVSTLISVSRESSLVSNRPSANSSTVINSPATPSNTVIAVGVILFLDSYVP
jgi:hypothetical protein